MDNKTNENGIVPYVTTGFPGGASSAKEAVIQEIASGNEKQNEMNQTVGGRSSNKRSRRGEALALPHPVSKKRGGSNKRSSSKRSSDKRSSHKRSSHKRSSNKRSSNKRSSRRKIRGGEPQAGQEVTVPQFQGDPAASKLSGNLNSLMLQSSQDAVHDKDISL